MGTSIKLTIGEGWPDRLFLIPGGQALFIEFKAPGERPSPLQQYRIDYLKAIGFQVEVHDDADKAIQSIAKRSKAAGQRAFKAFCRVNKQGSGAKHPMFGTHHSKESKLKISAGLKRHYS